MNRKNHRINERQNTALDNVLATVDVAPPQISIDPSANQAAWIEFGRIKENYAHANLANFLLVEKLDRAKSSKLYREWGFATWEEFVLKMFPFSVDTADRMIRDLRELGKGWFDLNDVVRINREAFRLLNPEFTDANEIVLAGEKYALTKTNSLTIQMVIKKLESEAQRKSEEASGLKSDLEKTRVERDNAKKAAIDATRKLREAQNPAPFADADEDHQVMLRVQSDVDKAMVLLSKLRGREMSEENQRRYVGLCHRLHREFLRTVDDALVTFDSVLDPVDPEMGLFLNNEPDLGADTVAEFLGRKKDAR